MPPEKPLNIAIIGGGASAAVLLAHLARARRPAIAVDVYDRAGNFARGLAYSTPRACHLLNVRAANMSALADDKEDFTRWIAPQGYGPADFVPRRLYGDYLEFVWDEAGKTIAVRRYHENVERCPATGNHYTINGRAYDYAVLASGNVRPLSPAVDGDPSGYYPDPWTIDNGLKDKQSIALIGSGLTAADAVLSLKDAGFSGAITLFSRHGLWPAVHAPPGPSCEIAGLSPGMSPLQILRLLRRNIAGAAAQNIPWQAVIDGLRPATDTIWQGWDAQQRASFNRHLYTLWNVHRHRMAASVRADLDAARLTCVPVRVRRVTPSGLVTDDGQTRIFDAVINCMGYRYDAENAGALAVSHRIGPARFGDLFETTAIPEIRVQARDIALDIIPF